VASKKKLKARLRRERKVADEMFVQIGMLAAQLQRVDELLSNAEFEGPTIEAWVAQAQQFLQRLVEERGIVKKSSGGDPAVIPMAPSTSELHSRQSEPTPDGEYSFLTDTDVVPAGEGRFA
jgi:hypothetical protein